MQEIRDKGSMRKIYQCKCYSVTEGGILMQIPRCYTGYEMFGDNKKIRCSTSSFKSLTCPGRWRWYLDSTYYCYGGEHRYRAVPHVLSAKLNMIAVCGDISLWWHELKNKIRFSILRLRWAIKTKVVYYKNYKTNKEGKEFYNNLFKGEKKK
jgi:hypothetical protein